MDLMNETKRLLDQRPRTLTFDRIAEGTDLPKSWIRAFSQGRMEDPGVRKVQALFNYLSDDQLWADRAQ